MIESDLNKFYGFLAELEQHCNDKLMLKDCDSRSVSSKRGVYFFFEPGEFRKANPQQMRVVRVGTHAIRTGSKSTLWNRLRQHRGTDKGTGNHRGSIFRLHVGNALLAKSGNILPTWGQKE